MLLSRADPVRVKQDEFVLIAVDCKVRDHVFDVVIKLLQNETSSLFRNLKDKTLRLFNIVCRNEHLCVTRAHLDYIVSFAHTLSFLIQNNAVFV